MKPSCIILIIFRERRMDNRTCLRSMISVFNDENEDVQHRGSEEGDESEEIDLRYERIWV